MSFMSASRGGGHPDGQADWMNYRLLARLRERPLRTTCIRNTEYSLAASAPGACCACAAGAAGRGRRGDEAVALGLLRLGSVACRAPARQHDPTRYGGRTRRSTGRSPRFA
ncbi:hypothetical protein [Sorangium sp. So ce426]|uniref:hypothetical protein n=1 Tax=Sorangium sp. So ce426 TaxID=3133312 RepID=UPI003F5B33E3